MLIVDISEAIKRTEDRYQIILILDKVDVLVIELEVDLYQRVHNANKMNELCNKYK